MIRISKRLKQIAEWVPDHANLIDVGCDHGILDIYLMQTKKNIRIIASDSNPNALNNAITNIKKYHLEKKIKTVLSNGLDKIDTKDIDTIIIAGMGSHTITGILYNQIKKIKKVKHLILQSNNDLDFLRYKITKLGYRIQDEELIEDAGMIYTIIHFQKGYRFYTKKQLYFGPCLLKKNTNLFQVKNKQELEKLKKFYPMIPKNHYHHRRKTRKKIKMLSKILSHS